MFVPFVGFPSVELLHAVVRTTEGFLAVDDPAPLQWPYKGYNGPLQRGVANYRGKVKLHGTNAAVRIHGQEVAAQSRNQIINPTDDNAGFAKWVKASEDYWNSLCPNDLTIFGEWCGPGIMKGTAINQIPHKVFCVFAVQQGEMFLTSPTDIDRLLAGRPADVHVLPWLGDEFNLDFTDREDMRAVSERLSRQVEAVENNDPWVEATFGVRGVGEGLVYYPGAGDVHHVHFFADFGFKGKGEKHKVVKTKEAVQIDPEVATSIDAFVELTVTQNRLEQGEAATGRPSMKAMGPFLKWVCQDVEKETKAELAAANLSWKDVQSAVQRKAREWYKEKVGTI